jgi:hypothetical protein
MPVVNDAPAPRNHSCPGILFAHGTAAHQRRRSVRMLEKAGKPEEISKNGVGPNTVSFLAGYDADYLFQTIERVASAVFPKVNRRCKRERWASRKATSQIQT